MAGDAAPGAFAAVLGHGAAAGIDVSGADGVGAVPGLFIGVAGEAVAVDREAAGRVGGKAYRADLAGDGQVSGRARPLGGAGIDLVEVAAETAFRHVRRRGRGGRAGVGGDEGLAAGVGLVPGGG